MNKPQVLLGCSMCGIDNAYPDGIYGTLNCRQCNTILLRHADGNSIVVQGGVIGCVAQAVHHCVIIGDYPSSDPPAPLPHAFCFRANGRNYRTIMTPEEFPIVQEVVRRAVKETEDNSAKRATEADTLAADDESK